MDGRAESGENPDIVPPAMGKKRTGCCAVRKERTKVPRGRQVVRLRPLRCDRPGNAAGKRKPTAWLGDPQGRTKIRPVV